MKKLYIFWQKPCPFYKLFLEYSSISFDNGNILDKALGIDEFHERILWEIKGNYV